MDFLDDHVAIDERGRTLPYTPAQVRAIVARAIEEGTLLAALIELPSGDLAVQIIGAPSEKIARALLDAGTAYARMLRGS